MQRPNTKLPGIHSLEMVSNFTRRLLALLALYTLSSGHAVAQDRPGDSARAIAASCASCHGTHGASMGGMASLAGRSKVEIIVRMQEFKSGKRVGTVMPQLANGYTDAQVEQLSGWFAAQKPAP